VAYRKGTTLQYLHQDHLGSTAVTTNTSGTVVARIGYYPFGGTRYTSGTLGTDKKFTGQRLDQTGLYYYSARYYDAGIGRFISPDTVTPGFGNPQSLNRYSCCWNNPLAFTDPTGHWGWSNITSWCANRATDVGKAATVVATAVADNIDYVQTAIDVAGLIPVVGEVADAVNAGIYQARGDELNAALSLAACIPVVGSAATVGKFAKKADNIVDAARSLSKVEKGLDAAKIGASGKIGEAALKGLGGESQVFFRTSRGASYLDQVVDGFAHESKVGYTTLSRRVRSQIAKEAELMARGRIKGSTWHFYRSPVTGGIGPSAPLRQALRQANIGVV
jgi:RHS repeat-associated protein